MLKDELCIITPCYNDFAALEYTLASLSGELYDVDQLVVIDSSENIDTAPELVIKAGLRCKATVHWMRADGVYAAHNAGINLAERHWIEIVNSGDALMPGARLEVSGAFRQFPDIAVHVFRQQTAYGSSLGYVYSPKGGGIWPHQSVIVSHWVYDRYGHYETKFRLAADQIFFAKVRALVSWQLHSYILTCYDLRGLSSKVSLAASHELYSTWRALGRGVIVSTQRAYIKPYLRWIMQQFLGERVTVLIRRMIHSHYSRLE